uniref:Uncharacterized protein n=2 Tax=Anguilla anguilla TaxID=7936 RepID=A0A0E9TJC1_ANGAN
MNVLECVLDFSCHIWSNASHLNLTTCPGWHFYEAFYSRYGNTKCNCRVTTSQTIVLLD